MPYRSFIAICYAPDGSIADIFAANTLALAARLAWQSGSGVRVTFTRG